MLIVVRFSRSSFSPSGKARGSQFRTTATGRHTFVAGGNARQGMAQPCLLHKRLAGGGGGSHPSGAAHPEGCAMRLSSFGHAQLDLFGPPPPADPLLGLAVNCPNACRRCGDPVAIVGPGKPPHYASLRCRSCDLHRGWLARTHWAYLTEVIAEAGAPHQPIALHRRSSKPEPNDDGVSVVRRSMRKD